MKREYIHEVFSKIPTIQTTRLTLRPMRMFDAFDMYEYARDPRTSEFLTWSPHPDIEFTKNYIAYILDKYRAGEFYDWAVTLNAEEGKMIGTCGFSRIDFANNIGEIGYVISPDYQSNGYATEAVKAILQFAFETLGFHRVEARFIEGNDKSLAVMQKCRMRFEGIMRESMCIKGAYKNIGICAILQSEYKMGAF